MQALGQHGGVGAEGLHAGAGQAQPAQLGQAAGQQWRATVVGALMTFDEDPDAVDAVGARATARLVLQYGDEATPFTGWRGDVSWS